MNYKWIYLIPVASMLMACGGDEGTSDETEENEENTENAEYRTAFGTCDVSSTQIMYMQDSVCFEQLRNVDLGTFNTSSVELTEKHNTLYIKFVNNADIIDSGIGQFGLTDISLTIMIKAKEGELQAGEYTEDDLKIKLTKGFKTEEAMKTQELGSNKTPRSVVINEISEEHVCGSFLIADENGKEIITATFDQDVKVVKF